MSRFNKVSLYLCSLFLLLIATAFIFLPEYTLDVGENDAIGSEEQETCFGCGDCSVYCAIEKEFSISASSHLKEQDANTYHPGNVDDYNLQKAWIVGKAGNGVGEWIEFKFDKADFSGSEIELNGLYLFNGYRKSIEAWKENSRIRKFKMIVNGKDFALLHLNDTYKIQSTNFPSIKLKEIQTIRFEIMQVYKGSKYQDAALSELKFKGTHHH